MIRSATSSVDAALYRLNNPKLAEALQEAARGGIQIRLLLDRGKYGDTKRTQKILSSAYFPFRLVSGRKGKKSKLHHKFAIFDAGAVATGSYNWTMESESENFENLIILREASAAQTFQREFDSLWDEASQPES